MNKMSWVLVTAMTTFASPAWADGGAHYEGEPLGWIGYAIFGLVFLVFMALTLVGLVKKPDKP